MIFLNFSETSGKRGRPKKSIDELAFLELPLENASQEEMKWYNSKMKQRLSYLQAKMLSDGQTEEEISEIITQRL